MTRLLRLLPLALVAAVAALAAFPAFPPTTAEASRSSRPARRSSPTARTCSPSPAPHESVLTTEDVKVTEDGKPVQNLSVLSAASAEGIGTVLLIDSSNSMKGSIEAAIDAARAFVARNPGQPISIVFFNAKPTVALPLTTDPRR